MEAAWFSQRHLKVPAGVRVHTGAVLVALVCVVISRLIDFKPGIVYGFIASTVLLVPIALDRNQSGRMAMYPMLMLLGTAMTALAPSSAGSEETAAEAAGRINWRRHYSQASSSAGSRV